MEQKKYCRIVKIKTIGSTYMAACGLTDEKENADKDKKENTDRDEKANTVSATMAVITMAKFAHDLMKKLEMINKHCFNEFKLQIGKRRTAVISRYNIIIQYKLHVHNWASRSDPTLIRTYVCISDNMIRHPRVHHMHMRLYRVFSTHMQRLIMAHVRHSFRYGIQMTVYQTKRKDR